LRTIFNQTTLPTPIYTLSLHDALPICSDAERACSVHGSHRGGEAHRRQAGLSGVARLDLAPNSFSPTRDLYHGKAHQRAAGDGADRKSTRLNSSHEWISYAVFCLKKKR